MVRTVVRIPTEMSEVRERLNGIERLLFTRKWERAAIVFAFTEVQTNKGPGNRPGVTPGKYNIRDFAALGLAGLTTNKSVSRYRDAWISAVSQGWAPLVSPGQEVPLPDQPFPAWPYRAEADLGEDEESTATFREMPERGSSFPEGVSMDERRGEGRPSLSVVWLGHLDAAAKALGKLAEVSGADLDDRTRDELVERLSELQRQTRAALNALRHMRSV